MSAFHSHFSFFLSCLKALARAFMELLELSSNLRILTYCLCRLENSCVSGSQFFHLWNGMWIKSETKFKKPSTGFNMCYQASDSFSFFFLFFLYFLLHVLSDTCSFPNSTRFACLYLFCRLEYKLIFVWEKHSVVKKKNLIKNQIKWKKLHSY